MQAWFWQFLLYSFLGYLLEKGFAALSGSPRQTRKCFLLLPLCPVYGLGVLAVLALPEKLVDNPAELAFWGGLTATAVEYGVHVLYDRLLGVRFWDYSGVWGNLRGRVCVPFSLAWGVLLAAWLPWFQPLARQWTAAVPPWATYAALLILAADGAVSVRLLYLARDPEVLQLTP